MESYEYRLHTAIQDAPSPMEVQKALEDLIYSPEHGEVLSHSVVSLDRQVLVTVLTRHPVGEPRKHVLADSVPESPSAAN